MTKSHSLRVFISHASADKRFALLVATALRNSAMSPWIDKEEVLVGDDVLEELGEGLGTMDLLVFIVSRKALQSAWVDRELKFAARREIEERKILILPFIIDGTPSNKLP
jgi:TIR domain